MPAICAAHAVAVSCFVLFYALCAAAAPLPSPRHPSVTTVLPALLHCCPGSTAAHCDGACCLLSCAWRMQPMLLMLVPNANPLLQIVDPLLHSAMNACLCRFCSFALRPLHFAADGVHFGRAGDSPQPTLTSVCPVSRTAPDSPHPTQRLSQPVGLHSPYFGHPSTYPLSHQCTAANHPLTHPLTHPSTHPSTHSLTHPPTNVPYPPTHPPIHPPTHLCKWLCRDRHGWRDHQV